MSWSGLILSGVAWDPRNIRYSMPVWWQAREDARRRRVVSCALITVGIVLYGIAVWSC